MLSAKEARDSTEVTRNILAEQQVAFIELLIIHATNKGEYSINVSFLSSEAKSTLVDLGYTVTPNNYNYNVEVSW